MVQGRVERIDPKGDKTPWRVTVAGKSYSTFQDEVVANLKVGMLIKFEPEIVTGKNERKYENLAEWKEIDDHMGYSGKPWKNEPPETHQETTVPAHVWEAKDRRIAMESAYSTAARMMQALAAAGTAEAVTSQNLKLMARAIYRDVQAAGDGKAFDDK